MAPSPAWRSRLVHFGLGLAVALATLGSTTACLYWGPRHLTERYNKPSDAYYLGPERGFTRIDSETPVIRSDDQKEVERYWIYRD